MIYTVNDCLEFVRENDVKFVRLAFCDLCGNQRNIAIMASELERAFTSGIMFDAAAVYGSDCGDRKDLLLFPDPSTMAILPWRPGQSRVLRLFCNIKYPDGSFFEADMRRLLENASNHLKDSGYSCKIGPECEFYLFEQDDNGYPSLVPHDRAGYLELAPRDRGENVRREICLTLEAMGIVPESSHHEQGPGQNEIDFKYSSVCSAADNLTTFKNVVKTVSAINGLYATFMPRPLLGRSRSALHINLSIHENGKNLFEEYSVGLSSHFMAGIINRLYEMTVFMNPLTNSYCSLGNEDSPDHIAWSSHNRFAVIRIPAASGDHARMELRSPDATCNPYIGFALLIYAGLEGIKNKAELPADAADIFEFRHLPQNLGEAINAAKNSDFIRNSLPEPLLNMYLNKAADDWREYCARDDKPAFDIERYFEIM